jgi:hypothetical protein
MRSKSKRVRITSDADLMTQVRRAERRLKITPTEFVRQALHNAKQRFSRVPIRFVTQPLQKTCGRKMHHDVSHKSNYPRTFLSLLKGNGTTSRGALWKRSLLKPIARVR